MPQELHLPLESDCEHQAASAGRIALWIVFELLVVLPVSMFVLAALIEGIDRLSQ